MKRFHFHESGKWSVSVAILICLISCVGCSPQPDQQVGDRSSNGDVEDGGVVENADRDKAEAYFVALSKVSKVEEEKALLMEFGEWLVTNGYKISVVENNGKHELACPYFPPVTPWVDHRFLDIENLELLPLQ